MRISARFHATLAVALGAFGVACVLFFLGAATQVAAHPLTSSLPPANVETTAVRIRLAPMALMTITVMPNPVTVTVGTTLTFSVVGQDGSGHPAPVKPVWDTNGGSIDASGLFTAQTSVASGQIVTATSGSVSGTAQVNVVAAAPYTVTLNAAPTTLTAGNNSVLTATVTDQYGNWVADDTPVTLTVSRGNVISPVSTTNGVATSLFSDTLVGTHVVTAAGGSAPPVTATVTFGPNVPYTVTLVAAPTLLVVGNNSVLTATVTDRHSNPVKDGTPVTFTVSRGSVISPVKTTNGVATSLFSDTLAGTHVVTAASGSAPPVTAAVTFGPNVPYTVTLVAAPASLVVGNNSLLTATVTDQYNNQVENGTPVTLTVSRGNAISPVTTTDGVATSLFSDTLAGTHVVTAASGSAPPVTGLVTFEPGEPFNIRMDANPPTRTVGQVSMLNITVTDRYGNGVAPGTQVTLEADWGNVWPLVETGEGGRVAAPFVGYQTGADHITATSQTAFTVTMVTLIPDVPKGVILQADPTLQVVGYNTVLTATVKDQFNNLVANGTPVTFTRDLGNVVPPVAQTSGGIATARISSTVQGTAHVTAASGAAPPAPAIVVFKPDAPYTVTLIAAPSSLVVGDNSVLTATVTDRYNNLVENGTPVTFTVSGGNVLSHIPTFNGMAISLFSDTLVGTRVVTAASGSAPPVTRSVTFTAGPPFTITVQVSPDNLFANSGMTATVTATITDRYENPLAGQVLTGSFPITTMGTISGPGRTNAAGRARGRWTAGIRPGLAPLRITNGVITGSQDVALISDLPTTLTVQINQQTLIANSGMANPITVTVVDRYGTGVAGLGVDGDAIPATIGSVNMFDLTDDDGRAYGAWTAGTVMGPGLLQVRLTDNTVISTSATVSLTFTAPHTITPQVNPSTLAAFSGATGAITATVTDRYGNLVPDVTLSGSTFPPTLGSVRWNGATDLNGRVFGTWTATSDSAAGYGVILAGFGSVSGAVPIALTPGSVHLPAIVLPFRGIQNGDFSKPNLAGWTVDATSVLSVSASFDPIYPGNPAALLGNPAYTCKGNIPIGYGILSQSFTMPEVPSGRWPVIKFNYHIYTNDKNYNLNDTADRFDVLLNGRLVFRDMNQSFPYTCATLYDLGRKEVRIPLTASQGDWIDLTFRLKNGIDNDYNTYVYLDDVRLEFEALP